MTGRSRGLAIVILVLAAGLALKAARYAAPPAPEDEWDIARVARALAAEGWQTTGAAARRDGGLYTRLTFGHPVCPGPLTVAVLSGNAEGAGLATLDLGGDVAFLQGGHVVARPSGLQRQRELLVFGLSRLLGLRASPPLPVLAISPAAGLSCLRPGVANVLAGAPLAPNEASQKPHW
jgi:hypothetical protein